MMRSSVRALACVVAAIFGSALLGGAAVGAGPGEFHWVDNPQAGTADLLLGEQPVIRYMYAHDTSTPERTEETTKVYHHVFGPGTSELITKGAGGEYPHHRGLYIGYSKTQYDGKSADWWHCKDGKYHQRHVKFVDQKADADHGTMTAEIHWMTPEGETIVAEERTITVRRRPDVEGWQIDWQTTLSSRRGEITLAGDRQHAGFQFRANQKVAEETSARYIRPSGFPQEEIAHEVDDSGDPPRHINLGWTAMHYPLAGHEFTVEYFEDPSLPKPSLFSERPYGRFGAYFKSTISPGHPLTMCYRLIVSTDKVPTQAAVQARYDEFAAELKK